MAIEKKTAQSFATDLETAIVSRNTGYDTKVGPIPDIVIVPTSTVLELQNDRIRSVQQLLSLVNDGSFTDADVDDFVYNELMIRGSGSRSTVTLIFSRSTVPTADLTVKANFPVATLNDEATGASITFLTISDATMLAASASSYFNNTTQRYELPIPAQAITAADTGNVGPNRITRPLKALNGFESVFNRDAAINGTGVEDNSKLIDRYYLSLIGTSPNVVRGTPKILKTLFSSVLDSNIIYGNSALNVRGATDSGAVDAYIIGSTPVTYTESITFPGANQIIPLSMQPVLSVISIGTYVQGVDYIFVPDASGNAGSVRATDGVKWLTTATTTPAVGSAISVTYSYNGLLSTLQTTFASEDKNIPGRDLLFKSASQVDITISANIKIKSGYTPATVLAAVNASLLAAINAYKLGAAVEGSDIQAIVRSYTSVDNFIITNMSRVGSTGTVDILMNGNEYARMQAADLIITLI